ncbi:MAG: response regulator [Proteobacteria bacterium]|jgi:DNA-binding NarL/FixJ family response regulator|nr:response regulator [Pseudomonadota bacterium]
MLDADPTPQSAAASQRLKVLVADDHYLVREGLKLALRQIQSDVEVVEADTLEKAVEAYRAHPDLDLVLLDLTMPGTVGAASALDGFERSCPDARVVVVSAAYDMQTVQWALRKGALGFIPKLSGKDTLMSALRFILDGGIYVPPEAVVGGPAAGMLRPDGGTAVPLPGMSRQIWLDEPKG